MKSVKPTSNPGSFIKSLITLLRKLVSGVLDPVDDPLNLISFERSSQLGSLRS